MATRGTALENNNSITREPNKQSTNSASMDLLGSSASSTPPARRPNAQPAIDTDANRASSRSIATPTGVRGPARISTAPSRLVSPSSIDRKLAPSSRVPPSADSNSIPGPAFSAPAAPVLAQDNDSSPSITSPTTSDSCRTSADCRSNICVAGTCQMNSGFATSVSSSPLLPTLASSSSHSRGSHRSKSEGTPTACSDPRCTLPADITSMNGAEENDISASLGSNQRAITSAATAGIVLAVLFAILTLLLVVPKIRDLLKRCFCYRKEDDGIDDIIYPRDNRDNKDDGSPEFGNAHASAFMSEKRMTMAYYSDASYNDDKNGRYNAYGEHEDHLPVYDNNGQGDIADMKVDIKQDDYLDDCNGYYHHQYSTNKTYGASPVLPSLYQHDKDHSSSTRDLASYVEHHPVTQSRMQKKNLTQLSNNKATAAPISSVTFVNASSKPSNLIPWSSPNNARDAQVRETVLPYTIEEDRDILLGLKDLGTPAMNGNASEEK